MKTRNLKKFPLENNFLKQINHFSLILFSNIDFVHNVFRTQSFPSQYRLRSVFPFPFPVPNQMSFQVTMDSTFTPSPEKSTRLWLPENPPQSRT